MKKSELINIIRETLEEEKPGLWANIRAKRASGRPMAKKGSKAFYEGKITRDIVDTLNSNGGLNSEEDFFNQKRIFN